MLNWPLDLKPNLTGILASLGRVTQVCVWPFRLTRMDFPVAVVPLECAQVL